LQIDEKLNLQSAILGCDARPGQLLRSHGRACAPPALAGRRSLQSGDAPRQGRGRQNRARRQARRSDTRPFRPCDLALKLAAATIRDLFAGDVIAFLHDETPIFDDIRDVLDQQFARLSPLERELLVWLAIEAVMAGL
jgi:hypothetical protein